MADNTTLNTGTGGDVVRDIDRAGVKTQVVQLDAGGSSAESLVSSANPLPARAPDNLVALNAVSVTAAAVLGSAQDTTGYQSYSFTVTGTYNATLVIEQSNDNTNWQQTHFVQDSTQSPGTVLFQYQFGAVANVAYGPIRAKYIRVRCSSFTSNTSSAVTLILRAMPYSTEFSTVTALQGTSPWAVGPTTGLTGSYNSTQFVKAAATTNATSVKASAGNVYGMCLTNNSAAVKYLKFYNKASAPTVGTDTPVAVFGIPANGGNLTIDHVWAVPRFSTGIAYAITGAVTDADTTAVAVNDVSGWIVYA